jgi:hypothetical protein
MSGIHLAFLAVSVEPSGPPAIGAAFGGGFFAGQISTAGNGIADYNLVIAPKSSGENSGKEWKTSGTTTAGTTSVIDGPGNTAAMIAAGAASHPAANFCDGLSIGGFSDWYMPAYQELQVCYYNLKPTTTNNTTVNGNNIYAVPSRPADYTVGNPAQTTATDFQSTSTQEFANTGGVEYWSSTEVDADQAWSVNFSNGLLYQYNFKFYQLYVRAVRRVAV